MCAHKCVCVSACVFLIVSSGGYIFVCRFKCKFMCVCVCASMCVIVCVYGGAGVRARVFEDLDVCKCIHSEQVLALDVLKELMCYASIH